MLYETESEAFAEANGRDREIAAGIFCPLVDKECNPACVCFRHTYVSPMHHVDVGGLKREMYAVNEHDNAG